MTVSIKKKGTSIIYQLREIIPHSGVCSGDISFILARSRNLSTDKKSKCLILSQQQPSKQAKQ